jgi:hypothetical protein
LDGAHRHNKASGRAVSELALQAFRYAETLSNSLLERTRER